MLGNVINEINNYEINESNIYDFLLIINNKHILTKKLIDTLSFYQMTVRSDFERILILYLRIYAKLYTYIILLNTVDYKKISIDIYNEKEIKDFFINMTAPYLLSNKNYNSIEKEII